MFYSCYCQHSNRFFNIIYKQFIFRLVHNFFSSRKVVYWSKIKYFWIVNSIENMTFLFYMFLLLTYKAYSWCGFSNLNKNIDIFFNKIAPLTCLTFHIWCQYDTTKKYNFFLPSLISIQHQRWFYDANIWLSIFVLNDQYYWDM